MLAGLKNTNGGGNVFVGFQAGRDNTSGGGNTLMGFTAANQATSGEDNTIIGYAAGSVLRTGSDVTLLGYAADVTSAALVNAAAIGSGAKVDDFNTMTFGNTLTNKWAFGRPGVGGAGIALQVGTSNINGNGAYLSSGGTWTNASDINLKENIRPVESAQVLGLIRQLPLSRWTYKGTQGETHLGPMAQDFYRLFRLGLNETSISTIDPAGVALVGVQELAKQNDVLRAENEALRQQLQVLQAGQARTEARLVALEQVGPRAPVAPVPLTASRP